MHIALRTSIVERLCSIAMNLKWQEAIYLLEKRQRKMNWHAFVMLLCFNAAIGCGVWFTIRRSSRRPSSTIQWWQWHHAETNYVHWTEISCNIFPVDSAKMKLRRRTQITIAQCRRAHTRTLKNTKTSSNIWNNYYFAWAFTCAMCWAHYHIILESTF